MRVRKVERKEITDPMKASVTGQIQGGAHRITMISVKSRQPKAPQVPADGARPKDWLVREKTKHGHQKLHQHISSFGQLKSPVLQACV